MDAGYQCVLVPVSVRAGECSVVGSSDKCAVNVKSAVDCAIM